MPSSPLTDSLASVGPAHHPKPDMSHQSPPFPNTKTSTHLRRIEIPAHVVENPTPLWSSIIVGHFLGESPHIGKVHAAVNKIWNSTSKPIKIDVQFITKTSVLFRITNDTIRDRVLKRKYWFISDIPLVVQKWSPSTASDKPDLSQYPLWVDLTAVPDHLFTEKGLKFLADQIGSFQCVHPSTVRCLRLDVARVMVIVDLDKHLPDTLWLGDDQDHYVKVSYLGIPIKCAHCSSWGHDVATCQDNSQLLLPIKNKSHSEPTLQPHHTE